MYIDIYLDIMLCLKIDENGRMILVSLEKYKSVHYLNPGQSRWGEYTNISKCWAAPPITPLAGFGPGYCTDIMCGRCGGGWWHEVVYFICI